MGYTLTELRLRIGGQIELARWSAFFELYPEGEEEWKRFAMIALNARRIAGDKRSQFNDFMPNYDTGMTMAKELNTLMPGMPVSVMRKFQKHVRIQEQEREKANG